MWASKKNQAFTIVELLIVIVVIGILAAITIVSFNGVQEKARIASGKAFAAQLQRSPDASDNATAIYNFDDCSGSSVSDDSELTNNGTIVGTATWSTDTPSGTGCSISLNGATRVTTNALISTTYYVKSAWVKTSTCGGSNNVISGPGSAFYSCALKAGHNGAWTTLTSSAQFGDGKWHHIALIYDAGNLTMYVDGQQTDNATGVNVPSDLSNSIGSLVAGNFYTGLIDDVLIIAR